MTGKLERNLKTNAWLKDVMYFDFRGLAIQDFHLTNRNNIIRKDYQYRFNGELLKARSLKTNSSNVVLSTKITSYEQDHFGRKIKFKYSLNGIEKTIASYFYDATGRMSQKQYAPSSAIGSNQTGLWINSTTWQGGSVPTISDNVTINSGHTVTIPSGQNVSAGSLFDAGILQNFGTLNLGTNVPSTGAGTLQTLNYKYHIRGGLRGINLDDDNNLTNSIFSYKLDYENDGTYFDSNIRKQFWKSDIDHVTRSFTYSYDKSSRIIAGVFAGNNIENYTLNNVSYDMNGNITNLSRNGLMANNSFGLVDNLNYTYNTNSNKILKVDDASNETNSFKDVIGNDYTYWQDGSLKSDNNKGIDSIKYNYLKLPERIKFTNSNWINYEYDAEGTKLKKTLSTGKVTDYEEDEIYENSILYQTSHDEGRIVNGIYEYNITDHLGNLRVAFKDSLGIAKITQVNAYGAFGDDLPTLKYINSLKINRYNFNGKEVENDFDSGFIDFKWRFSDPILGRFFTIDRLAEKFYYLSTFQFASNDPINKVEIDGLEGERVDNIYIKAYLAKNVQEKAEKANAAGARSLSLDTRIGPQVGISVMKGNVGVDANAHATIQSSTNLSSTKLNATVGASATASAGSNSISLGKVGMVVAEGEIKSNGSVKMSLKGNVSMEGVKLPDSVNPSLPSTKGNVEVNQYTNLGTTGRTADVNGDTFSFGVSMGVVGATINTNFVQAGEFVKNAVGAFGSYLGNLFQNYKEPQKDLLPDGKRK